LGSGGPCSTVRSCSRLGICVGLDGAGVYNCLCVVSTGKAGAMAAVEFYVEERDGGFLARSSCGCIVTQADTIEDLYTNVREAAACHVEESSKPDAIRLRFVEVVREETIAP